MIRHISSYLDFVCIARGIKMENRTELGHDLGRPNECQSGFLDDIVNTFSKRAGLTLTVICSTFKKKKED